jgi:hypothetical protein
MNPAYLNHFLACLRFLSDFERALHFITREEAQKNQIDAVAQVKGGENDETHQGQQSEAEGIETGPPSPHEQDRQ